MQLSLRSRVVDWVFAGCLIILPALVLRASLTRGTPGPLDQALLRITAPLEAGVSWVVEGIGGVWGRYVALVDTESENRELRAENEKLREDLAKALERGAIADSYADIASAKRTKAVDSIGAVVIGAPLSPQFRVQRIHIDRGQHDVKKGLAVISGQGPVGAIETVYGDYADVMLLSDPLSSVEVVVSRTGGRGMLTGLGRADSYACKLEWLERSTNPEAKVKIGDEVVTSGLGTSFPAGLVIGKVSEIKADDGMFQEVEVEPIVDVSRVRAVQVLLSSQPRPDPNADGKKKSEPAFGTRPL